MMNYIHFGFLRYIYLIIGLILQVHKREKWFTIDIKKGHPKDSWTYKRCSGQNWVWAAYGNDRDGVTPWFRGEQWLFWRWFLRNPCNNRGYHQWGYVYWEEGNPLASKRTDHLERKYILGKDYETDRLIFSIVRPLHRNWLWWKPYFLFWIWFIKFWIGWNPSRGQFHCSLEFRLKDKIYTIYRR